MRPQLTNKHSIPHVLADMTVEEKVGLLSAASACYSKAYPELGVPAVCLTDGATGVGGMQILVDYSSTLPQVNASAGAADPNAWSNLMKIITADLDESFETYRDVPFMLGFVQAVANKRPGGKDFISFPSGVNIGAAWNEETAAQIGKAVGWEMRNSGIDVCLGPNVDIQRDPLGGRCYEMYSEDPFLVSRSGVGFIKGMQKTGVAACAKHLLANNQETRRNTKDTHLSERVMREIYSPGFVNAVKEAGVKTVMSAYNAINGIFSTYNHQILTDWLKTEWGFEGVLVSDWGAATDNKDQAIAAGLDMVLPGPNDMRGCLQALADGRLFMERVDDAARRILEFIVAIKEEQAAIPAEYDPQALLQTAYDTLVDGCVLLKNDNDCLPLDPTKKVVFWGQRSKGWIESGTGSTNIFTNLTSNVFDEALKLCLEGQITFEHWGNATTLVYTVSNQVGEGADLKEMDIEPGDKERLPEVLKKAKELGMKTVVILNTGGPVDMRRWIKYADAIFCLFIPGCMGGKVAADILFGRATPAGRLPMTFPIRYEDTPSFPNFPGEHDDVYYGEGLFVGYRSYEKKQLPVQFPFGFGLSCTAFEMLVDPQLVTFDIRQHDTLTIPVQIRNIGKKSGSQVIGLYVEEVNSRVLRPVKELKAFKKVYLEPGASTSAELILRRDDLAYFDATVRKWVTPIGKHRLHLGTSVQDIFAVLEMQVHGPNPYPLGAETNFAEILANPQAVAMINRFLNGGLDQIKEMHRLFSDRKLSDVLSSVLIRVVPDAVKASAILEELYNELAKLE